MNIELGYILLSLIMNIIIILIGNHTINKTFESSSQKNNKKIVLVSCLLLWQLYIFIIGRSGILQDYGLPPRVLIFLILPAFFFTAIFLYRNRNNRWILEIPKHWLILYQTFRIGIETLFVFSVLIGTLPEIVTIKGYNFDMIFALTAPFTGLYLYLKKPHSNKITLFWNYCGLVVIASILFLFTTSIYFPQIYGSDISLMSKSFGLYPYPLVPAFLMPSAVFMHVLSIIQLRRLN